MKMVAGLVVVLVAAFALPSAFASLEMKDVITREAYENLVNSGAIQGIAMTKTIISNPILEEALITYANNKLGGSIFNCGETCLFGTCVYFRVFLRLSRMLQRFSTNSRFHPVLICFSKKGLTDRATCGGTCFQGKCPPGCICEWPVCTVNALDI